VSKTLKLAGEDVTIEDFSGRKAIRATKLLKEISKGVPKLLDVQAAFVREYEKANEIELTRTEARFQFPPITRAKTDPESGELVLDEHQEPIWEVVRPSRVDHLTEEDWQQTGGVLKVGKSPGDVEKWLAVFPDALELAEEQVLSLLALVAMPNSDVKTYGRNGTLNEEIKKRSEELVDEPFDTLMELLVVAGEVCGDQYRRKADELGDRLGNALRVFGLNPKAQEQPTTTSPSERPTSSTSSDEPTAGEKETPSTELVGASSSLSESG
jgi:hypothetical protein